MEWKLRVESWRRTHCENEIDMRSWRGMLLDWRGEWETAKSISSQGPSRRLVQSREGAVGAMIRSSGPVRHAHTCKDGTK